MLIYSSFPPLIFLPFLCLVLLQARYFHRLALQLMSIAQNHCKVTSGKRRQRMYKTKIVSDSGYSVSATNLVEYCCYFLFSAPHLTRLPPSLPTQHLSPAQSQTSKLILIRKVWFGVYLIWTQGRGSSFKLLFAINYTQMRNKLVVKFDEWYIQGCASGCSDRKGQSQLLFPYSG